MDPRTFNQKRLAALTAELAHAETADAKKSSLSKITTSFPLYLDHWLELVKISEDRAKIWDQALASAPALLDSWTVYLQSAEGGSVEAAGRAKDSVGSYFSSSSIWKTLLERIEKLDNNDDLRTKTIREIVRVPLYDYAEFYQTASDTQAEDFDTSSAMAETVSEVTTKRWEFESRLEIQAFTTDPLPEPELTTWNEYLDYAESLILSLKSTEFKPIRDAFQLYEKCLTITALYPSFWRRFVSFLQQENVKPIYGEHIVKTLVQALHYHPKNRSLRSMLAQEFESQGKLDEARANFAKLSMHDSVSFDLRHNIEKPPPSSSSSPSISSQEQEQANTTAYTIARNKALGKPITVEMIAQCPEIFEEVTDPDVSMEAWTQGHCPDPKSFADRLKHAGHLEKFFKVDSTLK